MPPPLGNRIVEMIIGILNDVLPIEVREMIVFLLSLIVLVHNRLEFFIVIKYKNSNNLY